MRYYDVLIIGKLANNDLLLAEYLSRRGLKCLVLRRHSNEMSAVISGFSSYHTHFKVEGIQYYRNCFEFLKFSSKSRLIVSFTGELIGALKYLWFLRKVLFFPPVINITTGSDITELAASRSLYGNLYRQYLKFADVNWCPNYPHAVKNIFKFKIPKVVFMRYPYHLDQNENFRHNNVRNNGKILFFHPAHLDWKINDPGKERNSAKGSDRFLRAFIKAVKNGFPACCTILDRGPDKDVAKKLISDAGAQKYFIWKSPVSRYELFEEHRKADVVVDQFDVGGLGGIAIEAMSVGKPVMIYLQQNCLRLLYTELPPVLNCHTEEEIYEQILKCADREFLIQLGNKARDWVYKNHSWKNCLDQFLFYYTLLTGHKIIDYGWGRDPYKKVNSKNFQCKL